MQRIWWGPLLAPVVGAAESLARLRPASLPLARLAIDLAGEAGDARRVGRIARRTLEALARSPETLARVLQAAPSAPPRRVMDRDRALEALAEVQTSLAPHGLTPFLAFGSLLGAVRGGDFIPGDNDIDLGVIGAAALAAMPAALAGQGVRFSPLHRVGGRPSKLKIHHPNGVKIDVKAFEPEPDGNTSWDARSANLVLRKRFPRHFGLAPMEIRGLTVMVPDCAEAFLEWQYGPGWRVPDPGYHMHTSGPVHGPEHRAFIHAAGARKLLGEIRLGRARRALTMARSMAAQFADEDLWSRLAAALQAAAAAGPSAPAREGRDAPGPGR
ncbi:MAG TPA: LicD family protein [Thermohalobaculum sp.]|nr:LicD family protein [Thermohalobaculum sp.]